MVGEGEKKRNGKGREGKGKKRKEKKRKEKEKKKKKDFLCISHKLTHQTIISYNIIK